MLTRHCATERGAVPRIAAVALCGGLMGLAASASAATIEGRVEAPPGVSGAAIPVQVIRRLPGNLQVVAEQTPDADGRFSFANLPAGEYWVASAAADGGNRWLPGDRPCIDLAPCRIAVADSGRVLAAGEAWTGLVLRPDLPAVAQGIVRDAESGAPLAGARVSARGGARTTHTDALGRYHLGGFNPGRVGLRASAPGRIGEIYPDQVFDPLFPDEESAPHTLLPGDNPGLDFDLVRGARLSGSLRARDSGAELGDVQLFRFGATRFDVETFACEDPARRRPGGCFDIDGLFPGTYTLVYADRSRAGFEAGYFPDVPCGARCLPGGGTPITLALGQAIDGLHGTVAALRGVRGTVRSAITGQPLVGATVIAVQALGAFGLGASVDRARVRSGPDGRFVLDGLPIGAIDVVVRDVPLQADTRAPADPCTAADQWCTRWQDAGRIALPSTGWIDAIEVAVGAGSAIRGSVRSEDGMGLDGATVWLIDAVAAASASRTTSTDRQGRYAFEGLPPQGEFHLAVRSPTRFRGVVHHPDRWCVQANCGDIGGTPVVLVPGQPRLADLVTPGVGAFADGFEATPR